MEEAQLLPRASFQLRETQLLPSGSPQSDGGHAFPPHQTGSSQSGDGDGPVSGGTSVLREETPSPDLALNSEGPELESRL